MVAIEYNGKTVECETAEDAQKELKKFQREEKKASEKHQALSDMALLRARAAYSKVVDYLCDEHKVLDIYGSAAFSHLGLVRVVSADWQAVRIDTEAGSAEYEFNKPTFRAIMFNGGGFTLALHVQEEGYPARWVAVGVAETVVAAVALPGRIAEMIPAERKTI